MKKAIGIAMVLAATFAACDSDNVSNKGLETTAEAEAPVVPEVHQELYGNYVGMFEDADENREEYIEPAKINISINQITADGAFGRSIVKGNDRPMTGKMMIDGDRYKFVMEEPGSDPHDGRFAFTIHGDSLVGTWECYDVMVKSPDKKFVLKKMPFAYNADLMLPDEWDLVDWSNAKTVPQMYQNEDGTVDTMVNQFYRAASEIVYELNASKTKLKESDLKNLKKLDLEIIRNTIFARHGHAFKRRSVRQFFDQVEWYVPMSNNVAQELTPLEKENITLLKKFEQYAEDNYDNFGR